MIPLSLQKLLSYPQVKKAIGDSDGYDNSPLHVAAENGFLDIAKLLLDNDAGMMY